MPGYEDWDDEFEEDFEEFDDYDDLDQFNEFDDDLDDFDEILDIGSTPREEIDIFDERQIQSDFPYDRNAVEIHVSTQLTSILIVEFLDNLPSLKRITCPKSIYDRIPDKYIEALKDVGISVEIKYNWGRKKYSKELINDVIDYFNQGKRSEEVAEILDMSLSEINYLKSKYSDRIKITHYKKKYDDELREEIKSLKADGLKAKEISEIKGIPVRSVYYILNKK